MKTMIKSILSIVVALGFCSAAVLVAFPTYAAPASNSVAFYGKDCVGDASWVGTDQSGHSYANLDPGRYVQATMPAGFSEGEYTLTLQTCGNQRAMAVAATVNRTATAPSGGTDFGFGQMKTDGMSGDLLLEAGDVIRVTAPNDTEGGVDYSQKYGWLSVVTLTPETGSAAVFNAADYVGDASWKGTDSGHSYANLDPGRYIEITLPSTFVTGTYSLSLTTCGNERPMQITVTNNRSVVAPSVGTDFSFDQMREDTMADHLILAAGDTVRITAPGDAYGWLNEFYLTPVSDAASSSSQKDSDSSSSSVPNPVVNPVVNPVAKIVTIGAATGTFNPADKEETGTNSAGKKWVSGFQNMTASYTLPADLVPDKYVVSVHYVSAADNDGLVTTAAGSSTTTPWKLTGDWDWSAASNLTVGTFSLKPGDVISLHAVGKSPYIQIDTITLTPIEHTSSLGFGTTVYPTASDGSNGVDTNNVNTGDALRLPAVVLLLAAAAGSVAFLSSKKVRADGHK